MPLSPTQTWLKTIDVLHITLASRSGSALYVTELALSQANGGLTVGIIVPSDFEWLAALNHPSIGVITIPVVSNPQPTFFDTAHRSFKNVRYLSYFLRNVRTVRCNLPIHFNFVSPGICQFLVSLSARRAGLRTLITMHDVIPHYLRTAPLFALMDIVFHWSSFRITDLVHVHTRTQKEKLLKLYGVSRSRCVVIPHGISIPSHKSQTKGPDNKIVFLMIGSLRQNKNIYEVIIAFLRLRRAHSNVRLVIAGRAPRSERNYWRKCHSLIQEYPEDIEVIDRYLEHDEFDSLTSQAACVVLPYTSFVAQSGVAMRVASQGVPMIASSFVSLNDIPISELSDNLTLYKITSEELFRSMENFVQLPPQQRVQLGLQLRKYCEAHFSWKTIGPSFSAIYSGSD